MTGHSPKYGEIPEQIKVPFEFVGMDLIGKLVKTDQNNHEQLAIVLGKEFVNAINTQVCKILGIRRSLCAPYHPQTNGLVDRLNGTIQSALGKLVDESCTWMQ
ncbi:hypothetical protein SRHO_G00207410 [Serrasalmus rhombeus]